MVEDYSIAVKSAKKVLKQHIEAKALIGRNKKWTIEVSQDGKVDGLIECCQISGSSFNRLVDNYFGFLGRHNISIIEAFMKSKEYFPETLVDVTYKDDIENVMKYLRWHKPDVLLGSL